MVIGQYAYIKSKRGAEKIGEENNLQADAVKCAKITVLQVLQVLPPHKQNNNRRPACRKEERWLSMEKIKSTWGPGPEGHSEEEEDSNWQ